MPKIPDPALPLRRQGSRFVKQRLESAKENEFSEETSLGANVAKIQIPCPNFGSRGLVE
jgi:hypothetical protein